MHSATILGIFNMGGPELLIIFFIILLLFGAKRMPELARGLGKSMREFKKATSDIEEDFRGAMDNVDPKKEDKKPAGKPKPEANAAPKAAAPKQ